MHLKKHESPTLVAYIENPTWKNEGRDNLDELREGRANITMGLNDKIDVIESGHRGEGFKDAVNYHDVIIYRKMNIGTMILGQESGKGAYAQSETQLKVLNIFLDGVHVDITTELQNKVNLLVDMNTNNDKHHNVFLRVLRK